MRSSAAQTQRESRPRPWVNRLFEWMTEHPEYQRAKLNRRHVLQTIANACRSNRLPDGSLGPVRGGRELIRASGFSENTFLKHLRALERAGFVVMLTRGGVYGKQNYASHYAIPAQAGCLDHLRARHEVRRYIIGDDGKRRREVLEHGEQIMLPFRTSDRAERTTPPCKEGMPRGPGWGGTAESAVRGTSVSAVRGTAESADSIGFHGLVTYGNTKNGASTEAKKKSQNGKPGWPGMKLSTSDLEDVGRLLELFDLAVERGVIPDSTHYRIWFAGAARHALAHGENPPGLFVATVHLYREREDWVTAGEFEEAARLLREHLYPR